MTLTANDSLICAVRLSATSGEVLWALTVHGCMFLNWFRVALNVCTYVSPMEDTGMTLTEKIGRMVAWKALLISFLFPSGTSLSKHSSQAASASLNIFQKVWCKRRLYTGDSRQYKGIGCMQWQCETRVKLQLQHRAHLSRLSCKRDVKAPLGGEPLNSCLTKARPSLEQIHTVVHWLLNRRLCTNACGTNSYGQ